MDLLVSPDPLRDALALRYGHSLGTSHVIMLRLQLADEFDTCFKLQKRSSCQTCTWSTL